MKTQSKLYEKDKKKKMKKILTVRVKEEGKKRNIGTYLGLVKKWIDVGMKET